MLCIITTYGSTSSVYGLRNIAHSAGNCRVSLLFRIDATMRSLLCLLALLPLVLGNLSSRYAFTTTLYNSGGDTYVLHWNFSNVERTIAFAVNVSTTGWVGFGLSPNGGMVNSDVVMGWVSNGRTYFHVSSYGYDWRMHGFVCWT